MTDQVYIAYKFIVNPLQPATEILIAELGYSGFESFVEDESGVIAYIQKKDWNAFLLDDISILKSEEFEISYTFEEIAQTNWNKEWEKNFNPINVDGKVMVRAPFHEPENTKFDIVIEPKMSFGTGHHQTTYMMIQHLLNNDFSNKSVLDMGCGTGVLAILAEKLGATYVEAIDIDNWCYLNSLENIERNASKTIKVFEGDASLLKNKSFDVIIANINRNILLQDIKQYNDCLNENGSLFLSGFYTEDIALIKKECNLHKLVLHSQLEKDNWVALQFKK